MLLTSFKNVPDHASYFFLILNLSTLNFLKVTQTPWITNFFKVKPALEKFIKWFHILETSDIFCEVISCQLCFPCVAEYAHLKRDKNITEISLYLRTDSLYTYWTSLRQQKINWLSNTWPTPSPHAHTEMCVCLHDNKNLNVHFYGLFNIKINDLLTFLESFLALMFIANIWYLIKKYVRVS